MFSRNSLVVFAVVLIITQANGSGFTFTQGVAAEQQFEDDMKLSVVEIKEEPSQLAEAEPEAEEELELDAKFRKIIERSDTSDATQGRTTTTAWEQWEVVGGSLSGSILLTNEKASTNIDKLGKKKLCIKWSF